VIPTEETYNFLFIFDEIDSNIGDFEDIVSFRHENRAVFGTSLPQRQTCHTLTKTDHRLKMDYYRKMDIQ